MSTTSKEPTAPTTLTRGPGTARVAAVMVLFATSGATGLMLEVVWSRRLVTLLGATTWCVLTVLIAFMGGLGIGAFLWGRWARDSTRPLRLYAMMEMALGAYTLTVPWLFDGIGALFIAATRAWGEGLGGSIVARVGAAVLALAVPTVLMGGTLPVLTRIVAALMTGQPGRAAGRLFAVNTAGAVVGCFATGCLLILWLGLDATNALAATLDLGVGLLALVIDRGLEPLPAFEALAGQSGRVPGRNGGGLALAIVTVSGFCGLAYEMLWTRGLVVALVDSTTYAFTLMLTAFLAGHATGSAWRAVGMGRTSRRGPGSASDWHRWGRACWRCSRSLSWSCRARRSPGWATRRRLASGAIAYRSSSLCACSSSVRLQRCWRESFPIAARLYVGRGRSVASSTGRLYGWNTLGSVLGAILAAAWLVPTLGTQSAVVALAAVQIGLGGLAMLLGGRRDDLAARCGAVILVGLLASGLVAINRAISIRQLYARQEPGQLVAFHEGPSATVTVHQRNASDRVININGTNVAGTNAVLRTTQKLQGHLPVLLHPNPKYVMQIGFGSGGTCRSVALHPAIERIDVVEISPDVLAMSRRYFSDIHGGVLDDPRVSTHLADARSYVAATERRYDLILSDSIHPRFRGNATLYTRDYFALCARRLRPGGIVSTWLPLYGLSNADVRCVLASLHSVFPHVQVWYPNALPNENTVILASMLPLRIDAARIRDRLARQPIAADLAEVGLGSTLRLLDCFLLGDRAVDRLTRGARLNTDDRPTLEFLAPRTLDRFGSWRDNLTMLVSAHEPIEPYLTGADAPLLAALDRWQSATSRKLEGQVLELQLRPAPPQSATRRPFASIRMILPPGPASRACVVPAEPRRDFF